MSAPAYVDGCIANVFTAFTADGAFDPSGQRNMLDYLASSQAIAAYFVRSGMGQMYTFSEDNVRAMAKTACEHMAGRGPVLVGAAGIWDRDRQRLPDPALYTRQAVELSQYAQDAGAAGVVHAMPECILPNDHETAQDVVVRYFETVCEAVNIPVFIYQPPGTAPEYHLSVDLIPRLAELRHMAGAKVSTDSARVIADSLWAARGTGFSFIVGSEMGWYAGLAMGAKAVIGQGCCVNPQIVDAVRTRFQAGDFDGALDAQRSINLLCEVCPDAVQFLKRYASEQGHPVRPHARPEGGGYAAERPPLSDADYSAFKAILESELARVG